MTMMQVFFSFFFGLNTDHRTKLENSGQEMAQRQKVESKIGHRRV